MLTRWELSRASLIAPAPNIRLVATRVTDTERRSFMAAPLSDSMVELVAVRLRVLGQPLRIKVVSLLARRSTTVQELADALDVVQQNVSQHLNILHQAGIVSRRREGARVRYELIDPHVLPLFEQATASVARQAQDLVRRVEHDSS